MKRITTPAPQAATALVTDAWDAVGASFERFCLTAGVATLTRMMPFCTNFVISFDNIIIGADPATG